MFWLCVSILPLVKSGCAVWGRGVIPKFLVQLLKSVLTKAMPRSCTIPWGILHECIYFSTAEITAWSLVFVTGYTIEKQENASITKRQWSFRFFGEWRGPLWSIWSVRNGPVSICLFSNGTSFLCLGFGFFVLVTQTISSWCTCPVKHARSVVESFCLIVSFWGAHMSTHFAVLTKSKTG